MLHYCPKSGLEWSSPFISKSHTITTKDHPIFSLTYPQLLKVLENYSEDSEFLDWSGTETQASIYLLGLAALNHYPGWTFISSPIVAQAFPKILQNWNRIISLLDRVQAQPESSIPGYVVSNQTKSLFNLSGFLDSVEESLIELQESKALKLRHYRAVDKEITLARLLGSQTLASRARLARELPEWASLASGFPTHLTPTNSGYRPLAELWKDIISLSILERYQDIIGTYSRNDVLELQDHLEDTLELGTPYCSTVLAALRSTLKVIAEFDSIDFLSIDSEPCDSAEQELSVSCDRLDSTTSTQVDRVTTAKSKIAAILARRKHSRN